MKGHPEVLKALNALLADELAAILQYSVHAELQDNAGLGKLHDATFARSKAEMAHARRLIEHVVFLEGRPTVQPSEVNIGTDIEGMFDRDLAAEMRADSRYNAAIDLAEKQRDQATADLLRDILGEEEDHIDYIERQQALIAAMGLPAYMQTQV